MRKVNVPIDMSSEQKIILGVLSMRQLVYLVVGGVVIYGMSPLIWSLPIDALSKLILQIIFAIPVIAIIVPLAFIKHTKYNMFMDFYLITKLGGRGQKGVWRKGPRKADWM